MALPFDRAFGTLAVAHARQRFAAAPAAPYGGARRGDEGGAPAAEPLRWRCMAALPAMITAASQSAVRGGRFAAAPTAAAGPTTTLVTWLYCRTVRLGPTCSSAKERKAPGRKPTQNCTFRGIYFVNIVKNFVK